MYSQGTNKSSLVIMFFIGDGGIDHLKDLIGISYYYVDLFLPSWSPYCPHPGDHSLDDCHPDTVHCTCVHPRPVKISSSSDDLDLELTQNSEIITN